MPEGRMARQGIGSGVALDVVAVAGERGAMVEERLRIRKMALMFICQVK